MRHITTWLVLAGALALGGAARAADITLPKTGADELKSICEKAGGRFSQDPNGYGCGTDCLGKPGTACTVFCPTDRRCTAQVLGARRPHSVADALTKPERKHR